MKKVNLVNGGREQRSGKQILILRLRLRAKVGKRIKKKLDIISPAQQESISRLKRSRLTPSARSGRNSCSLLVFLY